MKIYIDSEFKCHTTNPDGVYREFDVPFFDGKCQTFVESFKHCPDGERYVGESGDVFYGECNVPWKPYSEWAAAQTQYEADMVQLQAAYLEGVNSV